MNHTVSKFSVVCILTLCGVLSGCALFRDPYESQYFSIRKSCYDAIDAKAAFTKAVEDGFTQGLQCMRDMKSPNAERLADEVLAAIKEDKVYVDCREFDEDDTASARANSWQLSGHIVDSVIRFNSRNIDINDVRETVLHELLHLPGYRHSRHQIDYVVACSTYCFPENAFQKKHKNYGLKEARDICSGKFTDSNDTKYLRSINRLFGSIGSHREQARTNVAFIKRNPKNRYGKLVLAFATHPMNWPFSFELMNLLSDHYKSEKLEKLESRYIKDIREINTIYRKKINSSYEAPSKTLAKAYFHFLNEQYDLAKAALDELEVSKETAKDFQESTRFLAELLRSSLP